MIAIPVPPTMFHRPLALWALMARSLARYRPGPFAIVPLIAGATCAALGSDVAGAAFVGASLLGFTAVALPAHEAAHVLLLARESRGCSPAALVIEPGGWLAVREHARWVYTRTRLWLAWLGWGMPPAPAPAPHAGYVRVQAGMTLSPSAKTRIALAGIVAPLMLWAFLVAGGAIALAGGMRAAALQRFAIVIVSALAVVVAQPIVGGVLYEARPYSDLGYAANFFAMSTGTRSPDILRMLMRAAAGAARELPVVALDLLRVVFRRGDGLTPPDLRGCTPKRSCFAWIYKRDDSGAFTDRIVLLPPLGLAILKQFNATPAPGDVEILRALMADPAASRSRLSFQQVYAVELNALASRVWELADGTLTVDQMAERLAATSGVAIDRVRSGLVQLLLGLHRKYLLNVNWPDPPVRRYPSLAEVLYDHGNMATFARRVYASQQE